LGKVKLINPKLAKAIPIFRDKRSEETNLRILETLALHGKLSITDIHKKMHTSEIFRYGKTSYPGSYRDCSTINRRVRDLERQYYVKCYKKKPSQKHGKKKHIMQLTEKGWWVANLVSAKVRSEWRRTFKNYEEELEKGSVTGKEPFARGVQLLKMLVKSPSATENLYSIMVVKPFRDLIVSGYMDLDMVGEELPDVFYEKSVFFLRDSIECLRKRKPYPSWVKRLTTKERQALDQILSNSQFVQIMDETVGRFRQEWERTLSGISDEVKKFHKQHVRT